MGRFTFILFTYSPKSAVTVKMAYSFDFVKRGFQRFCENTSCHGFQELFLAKTFFWKVFWLVTCFGAFGITTYQVLRTIFQYMDQSSNTVIMSVDEKDIMYPPLRLCMWHWLYWVDFRKVSQLSIDKEALLFSFNFYTRIFSSTVYDVDVGEQKLTTYLTDNNFTSVFRFHQSIARAVPIISDTNIALYFDKTEVVFRNPGFMFCYTVTSEQMFKYFTDLRRTQDVADKKKEIKFAIVFENYEKNGNDMQSFLSYTEYNHYMHRWITHKTQYRIENPFENNFTTFAPPILLFPNALDEQNTVPVIEETNDYTANLKASACRWRSTLESVCTDSFREIAPNQTCQFICEAKVYKPNCSCVRYHYTIFMKRDTPHNVCRDEFYLLTPSGEEYLAHTTAANQTVFSQVCYKDQKIVDAFLNCMQNCANPCEIWTYTVSVLLTNMPNFVKKVGKKNLTNITLEYPLKNDVLIMVEIDDQSWEIFIGNVGGLLGIWTGASIVSFIQLIYLCCCADIEDCPSYSHIFARMKMWKKPPSANNNVPAVNTIHWGNQIHIPPTSAGRRI